VRLLLVEDQPAAARMLAKGLREHAYAVDIAMDGEAALRHIVDFDYDAVVLDLMLPLKDGLSVCRSVRAAGHEMPILIVTAKDAVDARIEGLDAGADDYLVKPFDFGELLARVRALVRRGRRPLRPGRIVVGPLTLDTGGRSASVSGRELALTAKEYAMLEYLAHRAGEVVPRADIAEHVWDAHYDPMSNIIDVYVQRLRRKLEQTGAGWLIRTRRGEGYQLVSEPGA
jgi:DNA-binding response OmpR family regulator